MKNMPPICPQGKDHEAHEGLLHAVPIEATGFLLSTGRE